MPPHLEFKNQAPQGLISSSIHIKINFNEFKNVLCSQIRKERKCTKLNRRPISKECKVFQIFNSFNAEKAKNALPNEMQVLKCMTFN